MNSLCNIDEFSKEEDATISKYPLLKGCKDIVFG